MSQKGREKSLYYLPCCHFSRVSMCHSIVISVFWKRCYSLASAHGLQKVCVLLETFDTYKMITSHFKTENRNPLCHVADTLPIKIHNTHKYRRLISRDKLFQRLGAEATKARLPRVVKVLKFQ